MEQWLYRIQDRFAAIGYFCVAVFRYAIPVLLVGTYFSLRSEWHWPDQRSLLIEFLGHFLWLIAVLKALEFGISAGSAALIAAMQPVLTALIAPYLLAERKHLYQWLGVLVGVVGVDFVIFLDAAFDPNAQCGAGVIFAIFRAAGYDADRMASLWRGA
jgi:drug/metabolite transporter (DMT)-like permease